MVKFILTLVVILYFATISTIAQIVKPLDDFSTKQLLLGKEYYEAGLLNKSEEYINNSLNEFRDKTNSDEATIYIALTDFANGNYSFADNALKQFIRHTSNSPYVSQAALLRAYMVFDLKNFDKAAILFGKAKDIINYIEK
jgi:tetratricopeptide (TPR) repeat protein